MKKKSDKATPGLRRLLGVVGIPLAVGATLTGTASLLQRARQVSRSKIFSELERRIGAELTPEQEDLAESGYQMLKMYSPSMLLHPVVAANFLRRIIQAREVDPTLVQSLVDIERRFRQAESPGSAALGVIGGLGSLLGESALGKL